MSVFLGEVGFSLTTMRCLRTVNRGDFMADLFPKTIFRVLEAVHLNLSNILEPDTITRG